MIAMRAMRVLRAAASPACQPLGQRMPAKRCGWLRLRPQPSSQWVLCVQEGWHLAVAASSTPQSPEQQQRPQQQQHKRREDRKTYSCPACGQHCYRVPVLQKHMSNCCADIVRPEEWEAALQDEAALHALLAGVSSREEQQRERTLELTFRQRDSSGQPIRQDIHVVAAAMGIPLARTQRLLQFAMRAVPLAADPHPVEVIYEDEDLVAVNKPPGVITAPKHRYTGGSIVNRIIGTLGYEPLTLHRLDMNTSGVLLFAKARDVVPGLHAQFRNKEVRKEYLALSIGVPEEQHFTVDAPIDRDEREKIARRVAATGKPAATNFRVVAASSDADLSAGAPAALATEPENFPPRGASLIQCEPLTGRTHQIRVHLAHRGHPIVGDDVYGLVGPWIERHALHAAALTVRHPRSGAPLRIEAPLPQDFSAALEALGLQQQKVV